MANKEDWERLKEEIPAIEKTGLEAWANGAEEDIRKRTREGETCLEIATFKNLKPVMAWLLEHDGDQIPHEYRYT